jgi:fido (protein-threonine AMPylation protein)
VEQIMIDFKYPEGATPIDPDEAEGLLLTHITTHGELNRWEQDNIVEAMAWIDKTKPTNIGADTSMLFKRRTMGTTFPFRSLQNRREHRTMA